MKEFTLPFERIGKSDIARVGGKNASLGEMFHELGSRGVSVPDGFATTTTAWDAFMERNSLVKPITELMAGLDTRNFSNLRETGRKARKLIMNGTIPDEVRVAIERSYKALSGSGAKPVAVAVRSSATAEDLAEASFAGQLESYLNIRGPKALLDACRLCYASLFTDRAIKYRADHGFGQSDIAVSVGVQRMVASGTGSAGVIFTLDPDTGFDKVVVIAGSWGLGENVVKGSVDPDEFVVFKPALEKGLRSIISKKTGRKQQTMVYAGKPGITASNTTRNLKTPLKKQARHVLTDEEIEDLARQAVTIERHYARPMDIEWAKDGETGELFIVQARPETVHASGATTRRFQTFRLKSKGHVITSGIGLGDKIASGKARIIHSPEDGHLLKEGEVLVTGITNPDWDPIMKKAGAIVTDKGGRTSHAAIVARELGVVAVVGTGDGTQVIREGQEVTVSCAEGKVGKVYDGLLSWETETIDVSKVKLPKTEVKMILADPDRAFALAALPNRGIGLMRLEFVISNSIAIHPMALVRYPALKDAADRKKIAALTSQYTDKKEYFIDRLSQGVATIAAAFWPEEVIVRMSDFKSNEYANLIGGKAFEPAEENPMIGFRGASRYYSEDYREGFELECRAMKRVREDMGFTNVRIMIPFCRTVEEGKRVLKVMSECGLKRGRKGLEVYVMIEIPSNVLLAEDFAGIFDGFSIGSNDLTQLTLGIDRDSAQISDLFNERNPAVMRLISSVIASARKTGTQIGLCGQAPSDHPEFAGFLVEQGINSISFTPDSVLKGIENIRKAEQKLSRKKSKKVK